MHWKKVFFIITLMLLPLPLCAARTILPATQHITNLEQRFNFKAYEQCQSLLHQCPKQGPYIDHACAAQIAQSNKTCQQLNQLSKSVGSFITQLSVKKIAKFYIIKVIFPADGISHYFLLTPKGDLIDTIVDLRKLDSRLARQDRNTPFFIVNEGKIRYEKQKNGSQTFLVSLKITKGCLACPLVGRWKVAFNFDADGNLHIFPL